ncbi:hypothetical protein [Candidatus Poriferisodalis sp.]|uniref:hypothetical protein n=1 Tax=Candidatus Poriferisodalis sp. TaxID=3101277 RepID=UPI003C7061BE
MRQLLSNADLAMPLLTNEQMSCAQAARNLGSPFSDGVYNWRQLREVTSAVSARRPEVTRASAENLLRSDQWDPQQAVNEHIIRRRNAAEVP